MPSHHARYERPTRRQFLQTVGGAAGAALSASAAYAHHHPRPMPQSLRYLDQRMYFHNMELVAHVPGPGRSGGAQMMAIGSQRFLFQGADVFDVTDARNPKVINKGGSVGG